LRIISLSTIPTRFKTLAPTLKSLIDQRAEVDEIRLYIPLHYRRFPDYDGAVPEVPEGVTIVRTEEDLGPASKVLFAVREQRANRAQILFCDDDRIFPPTWAADLFAAQDARPNECVALSGRVISFKDGRSVPFAPKAVRANKRSIKLRAQRLRDKITSKLGIDWLRPQMKPVIKSGYVDILQGLGGAVVRPGFFEDTVYAIPDVLWAVDDVWLSGMLAVKGIPIWLPAGLELPGTTKAHRVDSLLRATIEGANRAEANRRCIAYMQQHHKIWL
jgi:hypothetical protein